MSAVKNGIGSAIGCAVGIIGGKLISDYMEEKKWEKEDAIIAEEEDEMEECEFDEVEVRIK